MRALTTETHGGARVAAGFSRAHAMDAKFAKHLARLMTAADAKTRKKRHPAEKPTELEGVAKKPKDASRPRRFQVRVTSEHGCFVSIDTHLVAPADTIELAISELKKLKTKFPEGVDVVKLSIGK